MDLTSPLSTLIPSLDAAVLEVLARSEAPQSASAIWRASARGTRAGQKPVLDRLAGQGLVVTSPSSTGRLYALNRAHVLTEAILTAADARVTLVRRISDRLSQLSPVPAHAFLFGSFARREAGEHSDIDLAIILPNAADPRADAWEQQIDALSAAIESWTGNQAQTLTFTEAALAALIDADEPIVQHWRDDGIRLLGNEVSDLLTSKEHS